MNLIQRYVLRLFLAILGIALLAFTAIYLVVDLFEKIDNLLEVQTPAPEIVTYFVMKVPFVINQGLPVAALLATLIGIGILHRNREIIAMRAAGISAVKYAGPIVACTLALAACHFIAAETAVRPLQRKSEDIWRQRVERRQSPVGWSQEHIWYRGGQAIYRIGLYDRRSRSLEDVTIFFVNPRFQLVSRLDARRLRWEEGRWVAEEGVALEVDGSQLGLTRFAERQLELPEVPRDFLTLETIPEELDWLELHDYAQKLRRQGYDSTQYRVDLQMRLALPVTSVILALLGVSIALRQGPRGGIAFGVGVGLVVACLYLAIFQLGSSLATAALLPPILGVWSGNILFAVLGLYLLKTAPQ